MSLQFLGLDPTTANAKDVKREYARRLKTCRPDQDPEGFRVLHEAYTLALNEVEWRDASGPAAIPFPHEETRENEASREQEQGPEIARNPNPPQPAVPNEVADPLERLEAELQSGGPNVGPLVRDAETALYQNPQVVIPWGQFIYRLFSIYGTHPDLRLNSRTLCFEMENNGALASLAVVERLDKTGNVMAISTLTEQFHAHASRIRTPAFGAVASRLACAAAFWSPGHAGLLADIAYQNLDRQDRDHHMNHIEQHGHMRDLLKSIPKRFQGFWRQKLMHILGSPDWTSKEAREAIEWIGMSQVRATQVAQVLRQLLPENLAGQVPVVAPEDIIRDKDGLQKTESANSGTTPLWDQPQTMPQKQRRVARPAAKQPALSHPVLPGTVLTFVLILIVKACMAVGPAQNRPIPDPSESMPKFEIPKWDPKSPTSGSGPMDYTERFRSNEPAPASTNKVPERLQQPGGDPTQNPMLKLMNDGAGGQR